MSLVHPAPTQNIHSDVSSPLSLKTLRPTRAAWQRPKTFEQTDGHRWCMFSVTLTDNAAKISAEIQGGVQRMDSRQKRSRRVKTKRQHRRQGCQGGRKTEKRDQCYREDRPS